LRFARQQLAGAFLDRPLTEDAGTSATKPPMIAMCRPTVPPERATATSGELPASACSRTITDTSCSPAPIGMALAAPVIARAQSTVTGRAVSRPVARRILPFTCVLPDLVAIPDDIYLMNSCGGA
jgi:hypothetical protein